MNSTSLRSKCRYTPLMVWVFCFAILGALTQASAQRTAANKAPQPADRQLVVKVYQPQHISTADLQDLIAPLLTPSVGKLTATRANEESRNRPDAVVVQDYPHVIHEIDAIVKSIDVLPKQVLVDARILSLTLPDSANGGTDVALAKVADSEARTRPLSSVWKAGCIRDVDSFIKALQRVGKTKRIAAPQLLVLNKQRAEVVIGGQLGFRKSTSTETASIDSVDVLDVGTKMFVRPFVTNDGHVRLEVHLEHSSGAIDKQTGLPRRAVTEVKTNVVVADGNTAVIRGLVTQARHGSDDKADARNELIVLITVRVISADAGKISSEPSHVARPAAKSVATPPAGTVEAKKTDETRADGPGYTQLGGIIKLKLDRKKTQLKLYENTKYAIIFEREDMCLMDGSIPRLIDIDGGDSNFVMLRTLEPGLTSLTFVDEEVKQQCIVEITIVGDTRPLQAQLERLYPQASIQAVKVGESVLLRGSVAKPEHVAQVVEIAEQYYPKALNQLKVGETRVLDPQPVPTHVRHSQTVYVKPQPRPARTQVAPPVSSIAPATPQILLQTRMLEIDWKQLAESKIDLVEIVRAFETDPKPRDLREPDTKQPPFLTVAVPTSTSDGIARLLTATKAVKVVSRSRLVTLAGRPVEVVVGAERPVLTGEIPNGENHVKIESRRIGTTLKLTPRRVSASRLNLAIVVEHSQRVGNTNSILQGLALPLIRTHRFDAGVELNAGQAVILTETGPPAAKKENQNAGKGLMIVISPKIMVPTTATRPAATKAGTVHIDHRYRIHQRHAPTPRPIQRMRFDAPRKEPQDLRESVRELRGEVRSLRQDVGRMLKLLKKKEKTWNDVRRSTVSPEDRRILNALEKKVSLKINDLSLTDLTRGLAQTQKLNVVLDHPGLEEEGLTAKTPVSINVSGIKLKSALKLILEPLHLAYQVRDEVLVITSKLRAQGKLVVATYPVADLVIPIPTAGPVPKGEIAPDENKGAQHPLSVRPPAVDFDTLIETILSVQPDSWSEVGGPASIRPYKSTLSLVIRQTTQAHQEIAGLLEQLRRLRETQVTLEARFLHNLPADCFERLGIDFDFKKDADGASGAGILTDRQVELLLRAAQKYTGGNVIQGPKVTLFNGQAARVNTFSVAGKQQPLNHSLHMQPVVSADPSKVRLNLRISDRQSPGTVTQTYVNTIPDGQSLLIEIGRRDAAAVGVPILDQIPNVSRLFKHTGARQPAGRQFLLIRPRIVVQEEEEELLGIPQE